MNAQVVPNLGGGIESLDTSNVTIEFEKRLEAFEMWSHREILTFSWTENKAKIEVLQRIDEK